MFTLEVKPNENNTAIGMINCEELPAAKLAAIIGVAITTTLSFADSALGCKDGENASKRILEKAVSDYLNCHEISSGTFLMPRDSDDFWDHIEPLE